MIIIINNKTDNETLVFLNESLFFDACSQMKKNINYNNDIY